MAEFDDIFQNLEIIAVPSEDEIQIICEMFGWTRLEYFNQLRTAYEQNSAVRFDTLGFTTRLVNRLPWGTILIASGSINNE